jgi:hypothetical protein
MHERCDVHVVIVRLFRIAVPYTVSSNISSSRNGDDSSWPVSVQVPRCGVMRLLDADHIHLPWCVDEVGCNTPRTCVADYSFS